MLTKYQVDCSHKLVVILGKSYLVGCPVRSLFQQKGATVILCDNLTENIGILLSQADILILGTGKEIIIEPQTIKDGCVVFDIGIRTSLEGDKLKVSGDIQVV